MRVTSIIAAATLALAGLTGPAAALTRWDATLDAVPAARIQVAGVRLGEELAANAHHIGQRDLDRLQDTLRSVVERELERRGLLAAPGDASATRLTLTLTAAQPNRPTFEQLAGRGDWTWDRPGARRPLSRNLSLASFGIGGVEIEGEFAAGGQTVGAASFEYEESDIQQAAYAATWTDAHRGIQMFAGRLVSALPGAQ